MSALQALTPESGRPRSRLFRALGTDDPPAEIAIAGRVYRRTTIFKHDSWAATALYLGPAGSVVCKFNRREPVFGIPMAWLGRLLARRENTILTQLAGLPNVPRGLGPVSADGCLLDNAAAHAFIEGHPLGAHERLPARFFAQLEAALQAMHARRLAYVDLHKRENILVGDDGRPYLIDFQISFRLQRRWRGLLDPVLRLLQQADLYHLRKHRRVHVRGGVLRAQKAIPWFIRCHRCFARPFRALRRRLLVCLGFRTGLGRADSEHFAEDAVRRDRAWHRPAA